jgi:hypothetical protein
LAKKSRKKKAGIATPARRTPAQKRTMTPRIPGIHFTKLHFGRKLFWANFYPQI